MTTSSTTFPSSDALELLRQRTPLLDVRAPTEFKTGNIPNSFNLPILDDEEREQVGKTYKAKGHHAAVALGHRLVSAAKKDLRIRGWEDFCARNPTARVICWRGGQRSTLAQRWLNDAGVSCPRVEGGFKALRHICLRVLDNPNKQWWLLSGRTGSAKTVLIQDLPNSIDLEGLANHRGSAFGRRLSPQPTPVTFENTLAVEYLNLESSTLIVEDESRTIGRIGLPAQWHLKMQQAPIALIEVSFEERVEQIHQEYVLDAIKEYATAGKTQSELLASYEDAVQRIKRRLGGARLTELTQRLQRAFGQEADHRDWISFLLREYYDPMYDYQLERKMPRVRFRGNKEEVAAYLRELG
mgnify:CR=1 FL=1